MTFTARLRCALGVLQEGGTQRTLEALYGKEGHMKQGLLLSDSEEQERLWKQGAIDLTRPPLPKPKDYDEHKPLGECPFSSGIIHDCKESKCAWFDGNGCGYGGSGTVTMGRWCPLNPHPCSNQCMLNRNGICAVAQGKEKA